MNQLFVRSSVFVAAGLLWSGAVLASVAPGADLPWVKVDSEDGITAYKKEIPGTEVMAFRGEGVVDAPITRVASALLDDRRAVEWVDSLEESKLLTMIGEREFIQYSHIGTPFVLKDRDFVNHGKIEADARAGILTLTLNAVEDDRAPKSGYVRGEIRHGQWVLKSIDDGKRTEVSAEMLADPKGDIPKWLVNLFQKSWPIKTLQSLRKQVAKNDIQIIPQVRVVFEPTSDAPSRIAEKDRLAVPMGAAPKKTPPRSE